MVKQVLESSILPELEDDFLSSKDGEEKSHIVTDICSVGRVLNDALKTDTQVESDQARLAFEREKLSFEKEKMNFEKDKLALENERLRAEATEKLAFEREKLSFEKEKMNFEKDKLALDEERFEYETEENKRSRIWDVAKTAGGWIVTVGLGVGGWIFANSMAKKSFRFEEEGTISSMTGRKFFNKW